ncbi:MAG: hypothetical protein FGM32_11645 [Candidatus Kapabacteria bacterium]|nr:hypothetical protein [Candidatus Kapabacteria bacterium]
MRIASLFVRRLAGFSGRWFVSMVASALVLIVSAIPSHALSLLCSGDSDDTKMVVLNVGGCKNPSVTIPGDYAKHGSYVVLKVTGVNRMTHEVVISHKTTRTVYTPTNPLEYAAKVLPVDTTPNGQRKLSVSSDGYVEAEKILKGAEDEQAKLEKVIDGISRIILTSSCVGEIEKQVKTAFADEKLIDFKTFTLKLRRAAAEVVSSYSLYEQLSGDIGGIPSKVERDKQIAHLKQRLGSQGEKLRTAQYTAQGLLNLIKDSCSLLSTVYSIPVLAEGSAILFSVAVRPRASATKTLVGAEEIDYPVKVPIRSAIRFLPSIGLLLPLYCQHLTKYSGSESFRIDSSSTIRAGRVTTMLPVGTIFYQCNSAVSIGGSVGLVPNTEYGDVGYFGGIGFVIEGDGFTSIVHIGAILQAMDVLNPYYTPGNTYLRSSLTDNPLTLRRQNFSFALGLSFSLTSEK